MQRDPVVGCGVGVASCVGSGLGSRWRRAAAHTSVGNRSQLSRSIVCVSQRAVVPCDAAFVWCFGRVAAVVGEVRTDGPYHGDTSAEVEWKQEWRTVFGSQRTNGARLAIRPRGVGRDVNNVLVERWGVVTRR